METDNASPFIRGIQDRLDTIFGEENKKPDHEEVADPLKEITSDPDVSGAHEDTDKKNSIINEATIPVKSTFVRGIENRLDTIFRVDDKHPDHTEIADPLKGITSDPDVSGAHKGADKKDSIINEATTPAKSPFVRGIEDRLDKILNEDEKQSDQTIIHLKEADPLKEITIKTDIPDVPKEDGKKNFITDETISVIEEVTVDHEKESSIRILGDDSMPEHRRKADRDDLSEHKSMKEIELETKLSNEEDEKAKRFEQLFEELVTSTSTWYSPLKNLKSTVLSIEWEVTDQIMERFNIEVDKLSNLFVENTIILGFLRILRFLGRYIMVKGVAAHYISVKLLMSVYDDLEKVLLTKEMADAEKHALLCDDVKKYREWVETVDLTVEAEDKLEKKETPYDNLEKVLLSKEIADAEKHELLCDDVKKYRERVEPVDLAVETEDKLEKEETPGEEVKEAIFKKDEEYVIAEPIILSKTQEELPGEETVRAVKEETLPAGGTEMTPHEAFAFALEEIKKVIHAEFSALRAELKLWRQEK